MTPLSMKAVSKSEISNVHLSFPLTQTQIGPKDSISDHSS